MFARILAWAALAALASQSARAAEDPTEAAFRATYKELVETNTTLSSGSCTLAAQRMGAHLRAGPRRATPRKWAAASGARSV